MDTKIFKIGLMISVVLFILIGYSVGYSWGRYLGNDITRRIEQVQNN